MNKNMCVRRYHLRTGLGKEKQTVRLLFLTDIHAVGEGPDREFWKLVDRCRPDGVLLGGDLMVAKEGKGTRAAEKFVEKISEKYPVWYANGNHESRIREQPEVFGKLGKRYERAISGTRAVRLINRRTDVELKGCPLTICGLDAPERYFKKGLRKRGMGELLTETFQEPDRSRYTILLAHTPRYWRDYMEWGADLTLSGHYHGGVCLLGKRLGLVTPDYRIFVPECCGLRVRNGKNLIVSAGAGEHTIPFRIHNPREITLVELEFGDGPK